MADATVSLWTFLKRRSTMILRNISISQIDETDSFESKKGGNYWMGTLKTLASLGLKFESTNWSSIYYRNMIFYHDFGF